MELVLHFHRDLPWPQPRREILEESKLNASNPVSYSISHSSLSTQEKKDFRSQRYSEAS